MGLPAGWEVWLCSLPNYVELACWLSARARMAKLLCAVSGLTLRLMASARTLLHWRGSLRLREWTQCSPLREVPLLSGVSILFDEEAASLIRTGLSPSRRNAKEPRSRLTTPWPAYASLKSSIAPWMQQSL